MRAALLCSLACLGCGFRVPATSGDAAPPIDAASAIDAPDGSAPGLDAFAPACMTNPNYTAGPDGHRYRKGAAGSYDDAVDTCSADGAHLAVVESMAENTFVAALHDNGWIGIDDLTTEGTFRWITGSTSTFRGFTGNEPNNNNNEDCVYVGDDGHWNDTDCGNARPAFCECELGYVAPPIPACRTMPGSTSEYGRKYFLRMTPATFSAAQADCAAIGAYLFVPEDDDENDAVDTDFPGNSWVGISDQATEGTWRWVNTSLDTYRKWDALANAPHNDPTKNCAILDGDWTDGSCTTTPQPYACECDPAPP